ncbi:MAG: hypothetical protein ABI130_04815 [Leifsonia sp.]
MNEFGDVARDGAVTNTLNIRSVGFALIKGTRHLLQAEPEFDDIGPIGDRRYCLVDVERRRVLKTVQNPTLVAVVAREHGDLLEIVIPGGETVSAVPETSAETLTCNYWGRHVELALVGGPHAALLSSWLGRPVRLALAPRGAVVYGAPVSIVTTASLAELGDRCGRADLVTESSRFRSTFVAETDTPYVEESWRGRELNVGGIRVRIGAPIPRCAVIDLDPVTGRRNGRMLKTLASYRRTNDAGEPFFGVYAHVVRTAEGTIPSS